jgi:hypothetical protein
MFVTLRELDTSEISTLDLFKEALRSQNILYFNTRLTKIPCSITRSPTWTPTRLLCLSVMSESSLASISVSSFELVSGFGLRALSAKGTYGVAYISSGCVMFLNRSISTFTVLPVNSVRVESGISFYLLVGYMSNDMFNVLFCKEVDHNFVTKSVSLNLEETFGISEGTEFFVKYCTEDDSTGSNWRVCYPGLQSSISLTKRPPF